MNRVKSIMYFLIFAVSVVITYLICEFINPVDIAMTKWFFEASKQTDLEPYKTMLLAISDWLHLGQSLIDGNFTVTANICGITIFMAFAVDFIIIVVTDLLISIVPRIMHKKNK